MPGAAGRGVASPWAAIATLRARDADSRTGFRAACIVTSSYAATPLRQACDDGPVRRLRGAVLGLLALGLLGTAALPATAATLAVHEAQVRIGTSVQGRPIVAVHRWTDGATRTTLVIGSMHGN